VFVFATSDKGGTGRSVTSCNVMYRRALMGSDVCYLDFDFGSPTAGSIFEIDEVERGTLRGGLHSYLYGRIDTPHRLDVWSDSNRASLRNPPDGAGALALCPGDMNGGEFVSGAGIVDRCVDLLLRLDSEFDLVLVDLSAGRSFATEMVLRATADPALRDTPVRWLVYHRWTRQHIIAAAGLVYGEKGLIKTGIGAGHDPVRMQDSVRFVRTAVVDPDSRTGLRYEQIAWLRATNQELSRLAGDLGVGAPNVVGEVPLDPVLQWQEQLISDTDVMTRGIANRTTVDAFMRIAARLTDDSVWRGI
jgi:hypothetical protein